METLSVMLRLNRDAPDLPVKVVTDILKVGEKRHWAEEARQLIPCHRGEAAVFKGTEHTSTNKDPTVVEIHLNQIPLYLCVWLYFQSKKQQANQWTKSKNYKKYKCSYSKNNLPSKGVLPESWVQIHGRKCTYTTPQPLVSAYFPCDKQRTGKKTQEIQYWEKGEYKVQHKMQLLGKIYWNHMPSYGTSNSTVEF